MALCTSATAFQRQRNGARHSLGGATAAREEGSIPFPAEEMQILELA